MNIYELSKKYQGFDPYSNELITKQALNELQRKTVKIIKKASVNNSVEDCFKKSVINGVNICRSGESWPIAKDGTFLLPLIQINIEDLPYIPLYIGKIKFITLFVYPEEGIIYNDDSSSCIRYYKDEQLEYLKTPDSISNKPVLIDFQEACDFPSGEEISEDLKEFVVKMNNKSYKCVIDDKLFGWPFWCQSSELSQDLELIMQITDYDGDWICGDCPTIYVLQNLVTKQFHVTMQMY